MRDNFIFRCTECNEENYLGNKNKKTHPSRQEKMKYCPRCNKHTLHREKR